MVAQQNKLAYVTGTSGGIGKAVTEKLLAEGYYVFGLSRTATDFGEQFSHISIDLNDLGQVHAFEFEGVADEVLLVNNAGIIGEILPVGKVANQSIEDVMIVNTIAPQILMNKFLSTYSDTAKTGHILNISSGAGKRPIDAWASYCASKAALDLFTETTSEELKVRGIENWQVHALAPGVVDTNMQSDIRSADPEEFKVIEKFIALKNDNELTAPNAVAEKIFEVIRHPKNFEKTVISVRDF